MLSCVQRQLAAISAGSNLEVEDGRTKWFVYLTHHLESLLTTLAIDPFLFKGVS
jgi:hypothetical protein